MARAVGNIEKAWNVRGPVDASTFSVQGVAPFFYLTRADRDPGGPDCEWVHLLGDSRRWQIPPDRVLPDGTGLFFYKTPTGHLGPLVEARDAGRCFLLKEDRNIWQVLDIQFDAGRQRPVFVLIRRRNAHATLDVTRLAFGDGAQHELLQLAQGRSDEELTWAAAEGSAIAKAELDRRLARLSAAGGAARDPVTDVENRVQLEAYFRDVRGRPAAFPLAVLSVDIDDFKSVNDTRGHGAGDRTLRVVALQAATSAFPKGRTFRPGGDEFLVIRENCDMAEATRTGQQIRGAVQQAKIPDTKGEFSVTVSVGATVANSPAELDDLLERADGALYAAKHGGKNRVAST
jgi:diguanylate cyclase (GGDEF)-like protein